MEELKDKNFDELFKLRITEEIPEFEEESWLKMEQKLKKRDRLIFYRNASIILLFLSFGLGFYFMGQQTSKIEEGVAVKAKKDLSATQTAASKPTLTAPISTANTTTEETNTTTAVAQQSLAAKNATVKNPLLKKLPVLNQHVEQQVAITSPSAIEKIGSNEQQQTANVTTNQNPVVSAIAPPQKEVERPVIAQVEVEKIDQTEAAPAEKVKKIRRKIPISLAIIAGPDFNSTTSIIGGKTNLAFGIGIGVGVTKKLSVQTGINYGHKNYDANANNYTFNNPNTKNTITEVNAACKVIEIPLRASLNVSENKQRSIEVNAGLSSYLMLKEHYVYKYTAESGRADRLVDASNKNKHILSVIDLSATYNIKLKNKKLAMGIEPYVKIPLTGIGEGSVPLKSSGISLKLRYDFNKK